MLPFDTSMLAIESPHCKLKAINKPQSILIQFYKDFNLFVLYIILMYQRPSQPL